MKILIWIIGLSSIFLSGCATKVVHISTQNATNEEVKWLRSHFENEHYRVNLTDVLLSSSHHKAVILKSPLPGADTMVADAVNALKQLGYTDVGVESFNKHNHFYNELNIGIYLPTGRFPALPSVMQTEECRGKYITIQASNDKRLVLELEEDNQDDLTELHGKYVLELDGNGFLYIEGHKLKLTLESTFRNTYLGKRPADLLTIYDQKQSVLPAVCTFITIYEG